MRITLRQLAAFESIVRTGSVRKAADELLLSQAAISMSLRDLEAHLGAELFDRVNGKLLLSVFGKRIYDRVCMTLRYAEEIEGLTVPPLQKEPIKLSAVDSIAVSLLPRILAEVAKSPPFSSSHPGRTVLQTGSPISILDAVEEMKSDFGFITSPCNRSTLNALPIYRAPMVFFTAADSDVDHDLTLDALLENYPLCLQCSTEAERIAFTTAYQQSISKMQIAYESASTTSILRMVEESHFVGLLPACCIDLQRDRVKILSVKGFNVEVVINLIYRKVPYDVERQRNFVDLVQVILDQMDLKARLYLNKSVDNFRVSEGNSPEN